MKQPIWIVPLAMAGLVAVFGWWANTRLRQTIEGQLKATLNSTLNANVTALGIWTTNQTRLAESLADEPEVRRLAFRILEKSAELGDGNRHPADPADSEALGNYLRPRLGMMGYQIAQLVDTNFYVVATSGRSHFGIGAPVSEAHTNKFTELFEMGQPVIITPFRPEPPPVRRFPRNEPTGANEPGRERFFRRIGPGQFQRRRGDITLMQVAAPLRENGIVSGALALVINPDKEFTKILSVARTGESGETYAFDQTGLLISRSRFDDQLKSLGLLDSTNTSSALNLRLHNPGVDLTKQSQTLPTNLTSQPLIRIVANAVDGDDGVDVKPSRDYRGVPVVGAWRWLPQLGFGVVTQIDASEAFRPLRVIQLIFLILFLLLLLCSICLMVFSYANITSRRRLNEAQLKLKQLGQYTLEEKIGEGGMGVVYRARHALMRRETAVKLLSHESPDDDAIKRFEREVCLTCQLTHPNTIQVYDYGHTPEGVFYYAMEYLRGLNLHQFVDRFGPMPEGRVIHILTQVCNSLTEAHSLGLVHRDIKPANVFLCERGGIPDSVKVLDFGLVREYAGSSSEKLPTTGEEGWVGTPWFMAPEAIRNSSQSSPVSDIYSLGALAYYLLSGKYVFDVGSILEIYEMQLATAPVSLAKRTTNQISPQLDEIILRCLHKEPAQRPQSANELRILLMKTPCASSWSEQARAEWWESNRTQIQATSDEASASASPIPTVKIDFASRMEG